MSTMRTGVVSMAEFWLITEQVSGIIDLKLSESCSFAKLSLIKKRGKSMICNLKEILTFSKKGTSAIAAFNVFGFEDAHAVVQAAESEGKPVILMANRDAVAHMGVALIGHIMKHVAKPAKVPVCIHLDHADNLETIEEAIASGYSSVMIDASSQPFEENVAITKQVVARSHPNVSVESEIGFVGCVERNTRSVFTEPGEAKDFAKQTNIDALAVAVGTVHRMPLQKADLQFELLQKISDTIETPIVIHGSTGVSDEDLRRLVQCGVQKINLGTTLRIAFGKTLRKQFEEDAKIFDRMKLFKPCMEAVREKAIEKIRLINL